MHLYLDEIVRWFVLICSAFYFVVPNTCILLFLRCSHKAHHINISFMSVICGCLHIPTNFSTSICYLNLHCYFQNINLLPNVIHIWTASYNMHTLIKRRRLINLDETHNRVTRVAVVRLVSITRMHMISTYSRLKRTAIAFGCDKQTEDRTRQQCTILLRFRGKDWLLWVELCQCIMANVTMQQRLGDLRMCRVVHQGRGFC